MSNRCRECGHPLAEGDWTRCDGGCKHGGKWRFVGGGSSDIEARGRARAEERDCPKCHGERTIYRNLQDRRYPCRHCGATGRVRPLLCQTCEKEGKPCK